MAVADAETTKPTSVTAVDEKVERVVRQLNAVCKMATFAFAMSVGKLIVDNFYSGDLEAWRNRGAKDVSFRRLAKHPDLPMSPSALYRSTAIYEVCQRMGAKEWRHVSTSHVRLVLPLPAAQQARLLRRAEANAWPVARLRAEIGALLPSGPSLRGGRKRRPLLRRALRTLQTFLGEAEGVFGESAPAADLSPESARSLVQLLQSVQCACAELEQRVNAHGEAAKSDPQRVRG